jgi:subtilase family serine protease
MLDGRRIPPSAARLRRSRAGAQGDAPVWRSAEALEPRRLLSAATEVAQPVDSIAAATLSPSVVPAGSASIVGKTPAVIEAAYGVNAIRFGSTLGTGQGQTIAIIVAFDNPDLVDTGSAGFATSDLRKFDQAMGIADPPSFTKVDERGGTNYPPTDPSGGWENESALDVEWAHAAAPGANILLVEADSAYLSDLIGGAVVYAAKQPGVSVVSMSFSISESADETAFDPDLTTPAGHQGVTFVAGSGDYGVPGEYPAFSPNVVAVGATTLLFDDEGGYAGESGFTDSGGGVSAYELKPAYQDLVTTPSSTYRTIPDVSFDGDDSSGGAVYDAYNGGTSHPWYEVGGTSFGAPNWSGLMAIADQGRALAGLPTLDGPSQTLPRLYGLPAATFHDVTTGSSSSSTGSGGGYSAAVGYDLVTGRGSPVANLLVPALAGGTASIAGSVFLDAAGDGVRTVNDKAIAGWTVNMEADSVVLGTTTTAPAGTFSFTQLPAGTYVVVLTVNSGYAQTLPAADQYSITIGNGQAVTAVTFAAHATVETPLARPAAATSAEPVAAGSAGAAIEETAPAAGSTETATGPAKVTTKRAVTPAVVVLPRAEAAPTAEILAAVATPGWSSWLDWIDGMFRFVSGS